MGIALVQMSDPGKMVGRNVEKSGGRTGSLVSCGASARQNEEIGLSPCLWDCAGAGKHLMVDAKNLVRHEKGLTDSRDLESIAFFPFS